MQVKLLEVYFVKILDVDFSDIVWTQYNYVDGLQLKTFHVIRVLVSFAEEIATVRSLLFPPQLHLIPLPTFLFSSVFFPLPRSHPVPLPYFHVNTP